MRRDLHKILIDRLRDKPLKHPELAWAADLSTDECVRQLRTISGVDFGTDAAAWEEFFRKREMSRRASFGETINHSNPEARRQLLETLAYIEKYHMKKPDQP